MIVAIKGVYIAQFESTLLFITFFSEVNVIFCSSRQIVPKNKDQADLEAVVMTARITIDHSWSATQVKGRLAMLFQRHFVKQAGQKFSFTYLQVGVRCVLPEVS